MPAVSKKQQRFMGIVRAYQKGTLKTPPTLEVQRAATSMKKKDVKDFASTKHKGLPNKKVRKESFNEDYVKELEDGLVKMDYPAYDDVDKLMKKIAKDNNIDTTTLHMAFKTKHLMVPDDWAKRKMMEPVMIPKTPVNEISLPTNQVKKKPNPFGKRAVAKALVSDVGERIQKKVRSMTTVHNEGNLHKWFKGSKSKDGKGGWVNVVTGGTCASDEPGEGTPKCVSSSKRASMTKAERLSASRRKKKADPNQQSKSGAAKPTYVSTDKKKKSVKEGFLKEVSDAKMFRQSDENLDKLKKKFDGMDDGPANSFMRKRISKELKRRETQKRKEMLNPTVQIKDEYIAEKKVKRDKYGDPINPDGSYAGKKNEDKNPKDQFSNNESYDAKKKAMRDAFLSRKEGQKVAEKKKSYNEMFSYQKDSVKRQYSGKDYKPEDKKNVQNLTRKPVNKVGGRTDGTGGSYVEKPQRTTNEDYHSGQGEKKVKRTLKYMKSKGQDGAPGLNAMISRIKDHEDRRGVKKKKEEVNEKKKVEIKLNPKTKIGVKVTDIGAGGKEYVRKDTMNEASKYSSIVRAGIKLGGKKGGRLAQKGEKAALEYGKNKASQAAKGGKDAGAAEKAGAAIGGTIGGAAGFLVPDGPLMAAGEIAGGYLGSKVGGAIGKKIDNKVRGKGQEHPQNKNTPQNKIVKTKQLKNTSNKTMGMSKQRQQTYAVAEDMSGMSQKSGDKRSTDSGAGMTAKGVAKYNRRTGGNLKTAVTTEPSKLKPGSKAANRRKSFCARSKSWTGERGKAARRRWNCNNGFEPENGEMINEYKTMLDTIKRKVSVLGGKSNKEPAKKTTGRDAGAIARKVLQQKQHKKYVNFLDIDEEKKKCGEGEYYCNDDKKCKPIPKGYRVGYGGYLKPDNSDDDTNGKNGNGNGNGHGGNGNGGNGGGNGGGDGGGE